MAMKQYSANIPPPEKMSFVGDVANNWRMCNGGTMRQKMR